MVVTGCTFEDTILYTVYTIVHMPCFMKNSQTDTRVAFAFEAMHTRDIWPAADDAAKVAWQFITIYRLGKYQVFIDQEGLRGVQSRHMNLQHWPISPQAKVPFAIAVAEFGTNC